MDKELDKEDVKEELFKSSPITGLSELYEQEAIDQNLKGTIPGAGSREASQDRFFTDSIFDTTQLPEEAKLDPTQLNDRQTASTNRFYTDPHYGGLLDAFTYFIIGQGFKISAVDESPEVQLYLEEWMKINKFDGRDSQIIGKSLKSGECFVRFFTRGVTGATAKFPIIRLLNYWEISKIIVDEKDKETVIAYKRDFLDKDNQIKHEIIPAEEIVHIKFGDFDDVRGRPPFEKIVAMSKKYQDWLQNRIVFNRLKTSFYLEEIVKGTPSQTSSIDQATPNQDRFGLSGKPIKRMPKFGTKLTHNDAVEYKWLSPEVKADDAREDGRAIRMAICAGAQCPEFLLGDASNANYSSTLVAQNPFVRKIEWLQDFYEAAFRDIFEKVLRHAINNKFLKPMSTETMMVERAADIGWFRKVSSIFSVEEQFNDKGDITMQKKVPTKTQVTIEWPPIISQDIKGTSEALQIHQNMGIASDETLAGKLGYNWEEERRKMEKNEMEASASPEDEAEEELIRKREEDLAKKEELPDEE